LEELHQHRRNFVPSYLVRFVSEKKKNPTNYFIKP